MPFQIGHKKMGGRQSNAVTRVRRAIDLVDKSGIDPLEVLLELCTDDDKAIRLQAAKEVAKYVYPQQRSIEVTPDSNPYASLSDQEKLEKAKLAVMLLEERVKNESTN